MHVLLFSASFVEIRHKRSSQLVQVIEGADMKLLNAGLVPVGSANGAQAALEGRDEVDYDAGESVPLLVCRRGKKNDRHGQSIELFELIKTAEIGSPGAGADTALEQEYNWDGPVDMPNPHRT